MLLEQIVMEILAVTVLIYALRVLPAGKIKVYFVLAFLLLAFYKLYNPTSDMRGLLWFRHTFVYVGEALFYVFVSVFSKRYIEIEEQATPSRTPVIRTRAAALLPTTSLPWFNLLTDNGLAHILVLPIFVLIVAIVRMRLVVYRSPFKRIVSIFALGLCGFMLIHASEFLVESQHVFAGAVSSMPDIEFTWYSLSCLTMLYALMEYRALSLKKSTHEPRI